MNSMLFTLYNSSGEVSLSFHKILLNYPRESGDHFAGKAIEYRVRCINLVHEMRKFETVQPALDYYNECLQKIMQRVKGGYL